MVVPNKQYRPGEEVDNHKQEKRINFGQVFVSHPVQAGRDGQGEAIMPQHARLRNLTYAAPLKVDITVKDVTIDNDTGEVIHESEANEFRAFIGKLPIMLKSSFCHLCRDGILEDDPANYGECQFDQGGYFIINGAEKVVIAQVGAVSLHYYEAVYDCSPENVWYGGHMRKCTFIVGEVRLRCVQGLQ